MNSTTAGARGPGRRAHNQQKEVAMSERSTYPAPEVG
jgi:hypothetical protein